MKTTHQITLGNATENPVTFECTNGEDVMARLLSDYKRMGAQIRASDDYGFYASINGKNVAYTMIDI
jgi:hypothetical protein